MFKNLRYITFIAGGSTTASEDEKKTAIAWHKACSTLSTIILPNGVVWFRRGNNWLEL